MASRMLTANENSLVSESGQCSSRIISLFASLTSVISHTVITCPADHFLHY